jgi:tripartite-type tricarboxylate transporter receptor subunit TctC
MVAANYALGISKPDGLTLLHSPSGTVMNTLLTTAEVRYDIRKVSFLWLGSDSWLTVLAAKTTQVRRVEDLGRAAVKLRVGGTGVTSVRSLRPKLALELLGVDHVWVTGYQGSSDLLLALEKGEIHLFEDPQDGYKTNVQPREKAGILALLWQTGILAPDESFKRSRHFPNLPTLDEILPKERKSGPRWEAWKAAVAPQSFQYLIAVAPGVPADRVAILNRGLERVTQDSEFAREFEKTLGEAPDAVFGEQANRIVQDGLKKLFDHYQAGIRYLRDMGGKK